MASGVEGHSEALAGALGVPDNADAAVARLAAGRAAGLVPAARVGDRAVGALQPGGAQGLAQGDADGVELVVARHLLDERAAAVVVEHDEVAHQRQEPARLEHALQHHLELCRERVRQGLAGDGAPGLEPLPAGRERADAGLVAVRHHQRLVHGEQRGQLRLVGLDLLPSHPDGGVLVGRVLQLDDAEGQAVHEQDDVRPAGVAVLGDGELVDGEPVVAGGAGEVQHRHVVAAQPSAGVRVLDLDAVHEHTVEGAVAGLQRGALGACQPAEGVVQGGGGQGGVELGQRVPQPALQHHLAVVVALGGGRAGRDVRAVGDAPALGSQPAEGGVFDVGFGEGGHGAFQGLTTSISRPSKSATLRVATARS